MIGLTQAQLHPIMNINKDALVIIKGKKKVKNLQNFDLYLENQIPFLLYYTSFLFHFRSYFYLQNLANNKN